MASKGARYNSRRTCSPTRLLTVKRSVSASLATKCFTVVPTPPSWTETLRLGGRVPDPIWRQGPSGWAARSTDRRPSTARPGRRSDRPTSPRSRGQPQGARVATTCPAREQACFGVEIEAGEGDLNGGRVLAIGHGGEPLVANGGQDCFGAWSTRVASASLGMIGSVRYEPLPRWTVCLATRISPVVKPSSVFGLRSQRGNELEVT